MISNFLITILVISGMATLIMLPIAFILGDDNDDVKRYLSIVACTALVFVLSLLTIGFGYNSNVEYRQVPVSFVGDKATIVAPNGELINLNRRLHCNFKEGDTVVVRTSHCGPVEFFSIGISE